MVAAIIVSALSWIVVFSPKLASASAMQDQAASARASTDSLRLEVQQLKSEDSHLDTYLSTLEDSRNGLPITGMLPEFATDTHGHASGVGVKLTSMSVGQIAMVDASGEVSAVTSDTSTAGALPGQLYGIPLTIVSTGDYASQLRFLEAIQFAGPRVALVTGVRFASLSDANTEVVDDASSMTTALTIFAAPQTPDAAAALRKQLASIK